MEAIGNILARRGRGLRVERDRDGREYEIRRDGCLRRSDVRSKHHEPLRARAPSALERIQACPTAADAVALLLQLAREFPGASRATRRKWERAANARPRVVAA